MQRRKNLSAVQYDGNCTELEQVLHTNRTSSPERGWPRGSGALIPNPHSLLNIHFPLSVFQSSLLFILFRQGVNTFSRNYEETSPICDDPISRSARRHARSLSPLQKSFPNHRCYMWTEVLFGMVFLSTQELSGIVWTKPKNAQLIAVVHCSAASVVHSWDSEMTERGRSIILLTGFRVNRAVLNLGCGIYTTSSHFINPHIPRL